MAGSAQGRERTTVRFYFDFLSPYAYLAQHRLAELAARHGWTIDYRSIDLMQAKQAIGNTGPGNRELPVKLAHLATDLARWAGLYEVSLVFPPNYQSGALNVGLYYPACAGREGDYVQAAYALVWGRGAAPDAPATLQAVADRMGWDADDFIAFSSSPGGAECFAAATREAIERNVFGVPTMVVDGAMWWGNDRLFLLERQLTKETTP